MNSIKCNGTDLTEPERGDSLTRKCDPHSIGTEVLGQDFGGEDVGCAVEEEGVGGREDEYEGDAGAGSGFVLPGAVFGRESHEDR